MVIRVRACVTNKHGSKLQDKYFARKKSEHFWDFYARIMAVFADISGQHIGPVFKRSGLF